MSSDHSISFWIPFYPEKWLNSLKVRVMDAKQRGMYIQLLMEQAASNDGYLPKLDDKIFRVLAGAASTEEWEANRDVVMAAFSERTDDGRPYNAKMREAYEDTINRLRELRKRGAAGGRKSAANRKVEDKPGDRTDDSTQDTAGAEADDEAGGEHRSSHGR